jgi:hypothetical protein
VSAKSVVLGCRAATGLLVCLFAVASKVFAHGGGAGPTGEAGRFFLAYVTFLTLFLAFPKSRRVDLALGGFAVLQLCTLVLLCVGGWTSGRLIAELGPASALITLAGLAAVAPGEIEAIRYACRRHPFLPLTAALKAAERRGTPLHAKVAPARGPEAPKGSNPSVRPDQAGA